MNPTLLLPQPPSAVAAPPRIPPTAQEQAARRLPLLMAGMVLVWLACEAAAWAGFSQSPTALAFINLLDKPHFPIALAGMFVFYLCVHPGGRELALLGTLAACLAAAIKLLDRVGGWSTPVAYCACAGVGLASLGMLAGRAWGSTGEDRKQALSVLLTACLVLGSMPLIFFFLLLTVELHPTTFDALAYAADGTLGAQVPFVLGRWFRAVPALAMLPGVVYLTLPLAFMVIVVLHLRTNGPPVLEVLPTFLAVAVLGFALYNFFPLVGPLFAFENVYPNLPSSMPLRVPDVPRNCMPSLHTAWALVIWWQARSLGRPVRIMAGLYLAFTVLATVGYGAHYVFDLVVAFPSTMTCQALCMLVPAGAVRRRRQTLRCGVALTVAWLLLLRYGLAVLAFSPLVTAPAAVLTVAGCVWMERRLYRAAHPTPVPGAGKIFLEPI